MKIINKANDWSKVFTNGSFDIEKWKEYINSIFENSAHLFTDDMNDCISTGNYTYEDDYLPVLNGVLEGDELRTLAINSFQSATENLDEKIFTKFGKTLDVDIVLYIGLCNGAGWVTEINGKTVVLIGLEKLIELKWCDLNSMYGLIYHELGHVYQQQYGVLDRDFEDNSRLEFLWQLFTEGIAMYFEQTLLGDYNYYHQDKDGWKNWCDAHFDEIRKDFANDIARMTYENQRYFGDWVFYKDHPDAGYYLGARFIQYICKQYSFDDIISFDIDKVEMLFSEFAIAVI